MSRVLKDCHLHTGTLLQKSTDYFNKSDYPLSIVICIIAIEEIGKFAVFGEYQRKLQDVAKSKMKKLLEHKFKLTHFLESERLREISLTKKSNKKNKLNKSINLQKNKKRSLEN